MTARSARGPPGAGAETAKPAWRAHPVRGSTPPEAEIALGAARAAVTATAMPKGPKQQAPEPEWIGDGESTSPVGEDRVYGGNGRRERRMRVP